MLSKSTTERSARPISLCISIVLPLTLPFEDSRTFLVFVARGNIEYSAVIHPLPCPRKKCGTLFSILALQITFVPPTSIKTRSEEHTSELQSRFDLVCRLLLEKNKS